MRRRHHEVALQLVDLFELSHVLQKQHHPQNRAAVRLDGRYSIAVIGRMIVMPYWEDCLLVVQTRGQAALRAGTHAFVQRGIVQHVKEVLAAHDVRVYAEDLGCGRVKRHDHTFLIYHE